MSDVLAVVNIVVLSAYIYSLSSWVAIDGKSLQKIENSSGPRTDPCGTPKFTDSMSKRVGSTEFSPLTPVSEAVVHGPIQISLPL